ncbi:hypothetical protein ACLSZW_11110, partial [Avibacterium avium]
IIDHMDPDKEYLAHIDNFDEVFFGMVCDPSKRALRQKMFAKWLSIMPEKEKQKMLKDEEYKKFRDNPDVFDRKFLKEICK